MKTDDFMTTHAAIYETSYILFALQYISAFET
jgi:hypothetical protein